MKDLAQNLISMDEAPLQQSITYAKVVAKLGADTFVRTLADGTKVQVLKRRLGPVPLNWIARGPYWPNTIQPEKARLLADLCASLTGAILAIPDREEDISVFRSNGFRSVMTPQYVAEIDLTASKELRLAAQHGKWRNRLRRAKACGLNVSLSRCNPKTHGHLLALEENQRKTRRYRALPSTFTETWARAHPSATRLFQIKERGEVIAFMLVLLHGTAATYHIGWTGAQGRGSSAHHLLLWQACNWLSKQGYTRFDLGLIDTETSPGLARFKIGSGAQIRALGPTMLRLPRLRLWNGRNL